MKRKKTKRGPVITIDGPSGVGKTTVSRIIAEKLGLRYINTGAMYRSLAIAAYESGVDIKSEEALKEFCAAAIPEYNADIGVFIINGNDYSGRLRSQRAGELASICSSKRPVREFLVNFQRKLGEHGYIVMEGRDIGTVVFPDADIKFFLDAPHEIRASRRHKEVVSKEASSEEVSREIRERDARDTGRVNSPLKIADDAIYVDTGNLAADDVVRKMLEIIKERLKIGNICC